MSKILGNCHKIFWVGGILRVGQVAANKKKIKDGFTRNLIEFIFSLLGGSFYWILDTLSLFIVCMC